MFFALIAALVIVAVLVAAAMSLFLRRHGESPHAEPGWVPTDEVFKDPVTERLMRVWADPTGQRHYLPESEDAGDSFR